MSLLPALLCAALGLAIASLALRQMIVCCAVLLLAAACTGLLQIEADLALHEKALIACAIGIVPTALAVYLPHRFAAAVAFVLAANAGFLCGIVAALSDAPQNLLAMALVISAAPARVILLQGHSIFLKILAGWLIAIAILAAASPLMAPVRTAASDHMD